MFKICKFKAWVINEQKMIDITDIDYLKETVNNSKYNFEEIVFLMSMKKRDLNGEIIFEGDFLQSSKGKIYQVSWNYQFCRFDLKPLGEKYKDETISLTMHAINSHSTLKFKIIGNIFENNELLKMEIKND